LKPDEVFKLYIPSNRASDNQVETSVNGFTDAAIESLVQNLDEEKLKSSSKIEKIQ
jgi:hypothetical protein